MLLQCNKRGVGCYKGCVTGRMKWESNEINNLGAGLCSGYRGFTAVLRRNSLFRVWESKNHLILYFDWKQEIIGIAQFLTVITQKDCYNVTYIYIISISLSLSEFLKRLVLLFVGVLPKSCVTQFCNKLGWFCNIVTRGRSYNVITLPCTAREIIVVARPPVARSPKL